MVGRHPAPFRCPETARRMAMYRKIMVPLDGSRLAECVLPHVASIARLSTPLEVVFVCAVEPPEYWRSINDADDGYQAKRTLEAEHEKIAEEMAEAKRYLDSIAEKVQLEGATVRTEVVSGRVESGLIDFAEKAGADLIVIATHGRSGPSRWVWGSVADRLLRGTCVPVLMVRAPGCVQGI